MAEIGARYWGKTLAWGWFFIFVVAIWPSLVLEAFPRWEGRLFPVVTPIFDLQIEETPDGNVIVSGVVTKTRDCVIDGVVWRYGRMDGRSVRITPIARSRTVDHPVGTFDVGPWVLPMTPEEFQANAHAFAKHDCHSWLPWLTETVLYRAGQHDEKETDR